MYLLMLSKYAIIIGNGIVFFQEMGLSETASAFLFFSLAALSPFPRHPTFMDQGLFCVLYRSDYLHNHSELHWGLSAHHFFLK